MKLIKKNSKKGFTLVELVIVIAILAILALILVPAVAKYIGNADTAKNEAAVRTIYTNAVLVQSDTKFDTEALKKAEVANISHVDESQITINVANDVVTSVVYTVDGKTYTFDGKEIKNGTAPSEPVTP